MTTANEHQNLIDMLQSIGLREEEAKVYLASLELGPSSVWNIYLKCGIKRPTCYVILDELVSRGLASKTSDQKKTMYSVASPTEIAREFDRKREHFERNLSQFEALSSKASDKPVVRLYEGVEGVEQAYNLSLSEPEGTEILTYSNALVISKYSNLFERYIPERIKKNISVKLLLSNTVENQKYLTVDESELRETRFLPQNQFDPRCEMEIYNNKIVSIAHSETSPFATVIESASMAYDEKQKFMMLWHLTDSSNGQN